MSPTRNSAPFCLSNSWTFLPGPWEPHPAPQSFHPEGHTECQGRTEVSYQSDQHPGSAGRACPKALAAGEAPCPPLGHSSPRAGAPCLGASEDREAGRPHCSLPPQLRSHGEIQRCLSEQAEIHHFGLSRGLRMDNGEGGERALLVEVTAGAKASRGEHKQQPHGLSCLAGKCWS